jgi:hypothetical protein
MFTSRYTATKNTPNKVSTRLKVPEMKPKSPPRICWAML